MRRFKRSAPPTILDQHSDRSNQQWIELRQKNPSANFKWYQHEGKDVRQWIKDDLANLTQYHCAFCDGYIVEPESIEHFRPKSIFPQLAYSWQNLYFCCGGCQNHKADLWDEKLLCPDADDYLFKRYFEFDFTTGAIRPNPAASQAAQERASITIRIYGLDTQQRRRYRKIALRNWVNSINPDLDSYAYRDFVAAPSS